MRACARRLRRATDMSSEGISHGGTGITGLGVEHPTHWSNIESLSPRRKERKDEEEEEEAGTGVRQPRSHHPTKNCIEFFFALFASSREIVSRGDHEYRREEGQVLRVPRDLCEKNSVEAQGAFEITCD